MAGVADWLYNAGAGVVDELFGAGRQRRQQAMGDFAQRLQQPGGLRGQDLADSPAMSVLDMAPMGIAGTIGKAVAKGAKAAKPAKAKAPKKEAVPLGSPLDASGPVQMEGRDLSEWTPDDFARYGEERGIPGLGPATPPMAYNYLDEGSFNVPGGTEGKFTYYDLLDLKSQGIDPSRIDPALHADIQRKLVRTMTPENLSDEQVFNGMVFGMTSPNQPLFPNQLAASRLRARGPEDIDRLAGMVDWEPLSKVDPALRAQKNREIANTFGVQAGEDGGLGVKGSADYTRIAEMAKLFRQNPEWFRLREGEDWADLVDRTASQVQGLGTKTGAFSTVWQDPANAGISAIDRHMASIFYDKLYPQGSPQRASSEQDLVKGWNQRVEQRAKLDQQFAQGKIGKEKYKKATEYLPGSGTVPAQGLDEIMAQDGGDGFFTDQMLAKMGAGTKKLNYKGKKGEPDYRNPNLSESLQTTDWIKEPTDVSTASPLYKQAIDINREEAAKHDMGLFANQWMLWDRQRRRLEPHENMFPGLERAELPTTAQHEAVKNAHRDTGHMNYDKVGGKLRPTRPIANPSKLAYLGLGGALAPGLVAEILAQLEGQEPQY